MTRGQWAAMPQEPLPPQHLVMAQNSLVKRWRTQADPQTGAGVAASPLLLTGHSPRWPALLQAKCPPRALYWLYMVRRTLDFTGGDECAGGQHADVT